MDLNIFEERLLREKERLEKKIADRWEEVSHGSLKDCTGELSSIDNHPSDLGTELFERSKDLSLREHDRIRLQEIREALTRIREKTYGRCLGCGNNIPVSRLTADPAAALCIICQQRAEGEEPTGGVGRRPAEEGLLEDIFRKRSGAIKKGIMQEEVWPKLEEYGSADGPQDNP